MMDSVKKQVCCVIFDLDGTLVNTDGLVSEVLKVYLVKHKKKWDGREVHKIVGKTPLEAAAVIVEEYALPLSKEDLLLEFSPMFSDQWCKLKAQPGAYRLIKHLRGHGVKMALASNSPRANIETKLSYHLTLKESFAAIVASDEVKEGKPSPEIYLEAAKRLNMDPSNCLVIEDSLPGICAAKAAEMEVIAVPSLPNQSHLYTTADEVINSLLDIRPETWGLPPFKDWIDGTLPIEPWHIGGPVIKGYGRGSKMLGIPTASLSVEGSAAILSEHPAGVYFGWAKLSTRGFYKMVMSIGWNPYNNTEKTIEPCLLLKFDEDFYGEELHLVVVGYIRPEANLKHEDGELVEKALELPLYAKYKDAEYFNSVSGPEHHSHP
ncbi:putative riboflavin kinase [Helianthus anomalus]